MNTHKIHIKLLIILFLIGKTCVCAFEFLIKDFNFHLKRIECLYWIFITYHTDKNTEMHFAVTKKQIHKKASKQASKIKKPYDSSIQELPSQFYVLFNKIIFLWIFPKISLNTCTLQTHTNPWKRSQNLV